MKKRIRKRKCLCCRIFFTPDHRNLQRHGYCSKPECRKASKAASQKRWLAKPENRDYFRGPQNVQRVQEWRMAHPGYSRKKKEALQESLSVKALKNPDVKPTLIASQPVFGSALQDLLTSQPAVLIGLIAHLTDSPLQDDIAKTARRLQKLGNDILRGPTQNTGVTYDQKTSHPPPANTQHTQPIQLGGSPPGSRPSH